MIRKLVLTCSHILLFINMIFAQAEFGAVGSFWQYAYEPHDGNGQGWEVISVERDTLINGEIHKILYRTFYNKQFLPPLITNQGAHFLGTMQIRNDSVFVNNNLVLDFNMAPADTLFLTGLSPDVAIQVTTDTITSETISTVNYKKWLVQKHCVFDGFAEPYEQVTIVENVGQIDGYLLWNTDGCAIGGGLLKLDCYKNGDFTYPPGMPCDQLLLTDTKEVSPWDFIKIYPNPVLDYLHIQSPKYQIEQVRILDMTGKVLLFKNKTNSMHKIDLSPLNRGLYTISLQFNNQIFSKKFLKN